MAKHRVTLIPGDGVGPEIVDVTRRCIEATGVDIEWDEQKAGAEVLEETGTLIPQSMLDSIRENKVAIKGPITTPVGTGFRSVNVALRHMFNLYACIRPCKWYEGVRSRFPNIDLVVFRENMEDLYAGIEYEKGTDGAKRVLKLVEEVNEKKLSENTGFSLKPISVEGTTNIVKAALEYARANGRRKVTVVHKANIMKHTDGLFLHTARKVAEEYDDIEFEDRIVDNMCMQLVQWPEQYDVLVTENLYGDIISDLCAGLIGGLGMAPGANIGKEIAIFEATHGSAPKYKGLNKVNPTALILSGVLMLNHIGEEDAAERLEKAVAGVIREGERVTYDFKESKEDPTAVGTKEMGDAIVAKLEKSSAAAK